MSIAIQCSCGKKFKAKDDQAGKHFKCSQCGASIAVASEKMPLEPSVTVPSPRSATNFKVFVGACAAIGVGVISWAVWVIVSHDNWQTENSDRIIAKLEETNRLEKANPLQAYKTYDEVLNEAKLHKITYELLLNKLADAEKSRAALYEEVQAQIKAEEAEKAEKERLVVAERQRTAQETQRAADAAAKLAEDKRRADDELRAEEKRRKEAVAVYRAAPQSARDALNALKKVGARVEIGINYRDYSTVVGETWADVKIFLDSPDGKKLKEFSALLAAAVQDYKVAKDIWTFKTENTIIDGDRWGAGKLQRKCWRQAGQYIKLAGDLLAPETTEKAMQDVAALSDKEENLADEWQRLEIEIERDR